MLIGYARVPLAGGQRRDERRVFAGRWELDTSRFGGRAG